MYHSRRDFMNIYLCINKGSLKVVLLGPVLSRRLKARFLCPNKETPSQVFCPTRVSLIEMFDIMSASKSCKFNVRGTPSLDQRRIPKWMNVDQVPWYQTHPYSGFNYIVLSFLTVTLWDVNKIPPSYKNSISMNTSNVFNQHSREYHRLKFIFKHTQITTEKFHFLCH